MGVIDAVQHHVHPADAGHGAIVVQPHKVTAVVHDGVLLGAGGGAIDAMRCAVPFQHQVVLGRVLAHQVLLGAEQKTAGASGWVNDALTKIGVEQFDHEADQVARRAELAVFAGGGHLAQQVLKGVAHDVLGGRAVAGHGKQLVDLVDGVTEHLALVGVELKVGVGHAVVQAGQLGGFIGSGFEVLVQLAQPREHGLDQVPWVGFFLPDVAPFAGLGAGVNGRQAACLALQVNGVQSLEKQQVGDLLHGHQGVGQASCPEAVPEFVNLFLDVGGEHGKDPLVLFVRSSCELRPLRRPAGWPGLAARQCRAAQTRLQPGPGAKTAARRVPRA